MSRNLVPLCFAAALLAGPAIADVPRVAVDITPVHSLVARVMHGVGTPSLIVDSGASPHEYSLRPSQAGALQDADMVFWIGSDLTPWLEDAIGTLAADARVVELIETEGTIELPLRTGALFEAHDHGEDDHGDDHADPAHDDHADHDDHAGHDHADHDHAHDDHGDDHTHDDHAETGEDQAHDHKDEDHAGHEGHAHGTYDSHAWLSPDNGAVWLNAIAAALSAADPDNAGAYYANAAAGRAELDTLKSEINGILEPVRGRNFIVFHDAYQYFESAFDFPASGAISISDATDPSPARIAEIQARVADQNVSCVLSEPQFNTGIVDAVMGASAARSGVLDPLGSDLEPGQGLYPQMLRNLATSLADCL